MAKTLKHCIHGYGQMLAFHIIRAPPEFTGTNDNHSRGECSTAELQSMQRFSQEKILRGKHHLPTMDLPITLSNTNMCLLSLFSGRSVNQDCHPNLRLAKAYFDYSSATKERNFMKLDRKQLLNVLYQVFFFLIDPSTKMYRRYYSD